MPGPHAPLRAVSTSYGRAAPQFEQRLSGGTQTRLDAVDRFLFRAIGAAAPVVELGAGTGRLMAKLGHTALGVDISGAMCREAAKRGHTVLQADQARTPLRTASVGAVLSGYGAARYSAPAELLGEIARVLRDDGVFALHMFPARVLSVRKVLRAPIKPFDWWVAPGAAPFDLASWQATRALFCEAGLWLTARKALRNLPLPRGYVSFERVLPFALGHHVALSGRRLTRQVVDQRQRVLRDLADHGSASVTVGGTSMAPTYELGQSVSVSPCERPRRGDVVLIQAEAGMILHRVAAVAPGKRPPWFAHQGDAKGSRMRYAPAWRIMARIGPA